MPGQQVYGGVALTDESPRTLVNLKDDILSEVEASNNMCLIILKGLVGNDELEKNPGLISVVPETYHDNMKFILDRLREVNRKLLRIQSLIG